MGTRSIEFGVEGARRGGDSIIVIGRVYQGPILVGDTFVLAYQYVERSVDTGASASLLGRSGDRPVALRVKAIRAYRQALDEIHAGMSAELHLVSEGADEVGASDVLAGTM